MAITNGYATLAQVKEALAIKSATTTHDTVIERIVEAVSRLIDARTGKRFYDTTETRYFTAEDAGLLILRTPLLSVSALKTLTQNSAGTRTYGDTWSTTDYDLEPDNASLETRPYTRIARNPGGLYSFPRDARGVEIAGDWGYCTAANQPPQVLRACIQQCALIFKGPASPKGSRSGSRNGLGTMAVAKGLDPTVVELLGEFIDDGALLLA